MVSSTALTMVMSNVREYTASELGADCPATFEQYHIISTDLSHHSDSAYYVNYKKKKLLIGLDDKFYQQQKKECSLKCIFNHTLTRRNKGHIKNGERSFYKAISSLVS